jgi:multiple sugar transport system substrate-binding protein
MNEEETKVLLDSPESIEGLQFFSDLIHVHKVAPTPAQTGAFPAGIWIAGVVAMFGLATWGTPQMAEFGNFEYDVAPWPKGPKGRKTGSFGSGYGTTKDSKYPDQAWTYLSQYLSKEGMEFMWGTSGRGSPARKEAYQSWLDSEIAPPQAKYYLDALEQYAVTGHPYKIAAAGEVQNIFGKYTSLVQTGDMSVEEAVQQIMTDVTPILG